ncbi:MAG: metallophosphoesterase family protein, partial [Gaiellaceae bacterium]
GTGFPRRAKGTASFAGTEGIRWRASRKGRFSAVMPVPTGVGQRGVVVKRGHTRFIFAITVQPDPTLAAAGDIACGADSTSASCKAGATSDLILGLNPTAVLPLGDVQYEKGQYDNFLHFYDPTWGRLRAITHPAVGNHEYGTPNASGYFDYFDGVGRPTGQAGDRGKGYYAFDLGAWRLYALNSNCTRPEAPGCGEGSAQLNWLKADLAAHPRRCSLAFMHHPMFTSDTREFDTPAFRDKLRPLWQAFYDHGGDVVLVGHSHFYERYAPQDPQGNPDPTHGIRQFIVGTGGRNVYEPGTPLERNSEVHDGKTFGVIDMTLHGSGYDWRFVPVPGKTFTDAGSQACH